MSEENKAIGRRVWEELWNQANMDAADEIFDSNFISHGQGIELPPGPEGFRKLVSIYRNAFPDVHFTIEDQIAEGDKVVTRWTSRSTHKGELMGIPATGKKTVSTGITISKFADGKVIESWNNWDRLGLMQQIGVVPEMGKKGD